MKQMIRNLFLPDGSSHSLSTAMSARSGMGKTTLLTRLITEARKDEAFKETRFIYVSVKAEHLFKEKKLKPVSSVEKALKNMRKNPITVFYPMQPEYYEEDVDQLSHISGVKVKQEFLPFLLGHEGGGKVLDIGEGVKIGRASCRERV